MGKLSLFIFFPLIMLGISSVRAQDTIVGWTFPEGSKNSIADKGNDSNKDGMFIYTAKIDGSTFSSLLYFSSDGYHTKSAASVKWDSARDLKCWVFNCDARGYKNLMFDARISSDSNQPGPRDFKIQYMLGCCDPEWVDVPDAATFRVSTDWTSANLKGIKLPANADTMPGLQIRFVCLSDTATDGSVLKPTSKSLIDEVYVFGTKITSINENKISFGIEIYPNPASDIIQIKAQKPILYYKLFDLSGKLIKSEPVNSSTYKLFCSDLNPGCYLIDFSFQDDYHFNQKIIIQ